MVYTFNGILFSLIKEVNSAICDMYEPWGHYAKQNKPVTGDKYCMIPFIGNINI